MLKISGVTVTTACHREPFTQRLFAAQRAWEQQIIFRGYAASNLDKTIDAGVKRAPWCSAFRRRQIIGQRFDRF